MVVCLYSGNGLLGRRCTGPKSRCSLQSEEAVFVMRYSSGDVSTETFRCVPQVVSGDILRRLAVLLTAIGCAGVGSFLLGRGVYGVPGGVSRTL